MSGWLGDSVARQTSGWLGGGMSSKARVAGGWVSSKANE